MDLPDVIEHATRLGPIVHLATADAACNPHVVPVHANWHEGRLYAAIGTTDAKATNIRDNPSVCVHWQVSESANWDSLVLWGRARLLHDAGAKRRMWDVMTYDLDDFEPGGPDDSPETAFVEVKPTKALLLVRYGLDGRLEWRADRA